MNLRTNYWTNKLNSNNVRPDAAGFWNREVATTAKRECRRRGYSRATGIERGSLPAAFNFVASDDQTSAGWGYENLRNSGNNWRARTYQWVRWSATCVKRVRR